jgi:hypothetical protein
MHTVVYKWFLVPGSLHVVNIKVPLGVKSCPTGICMVLGFLQEICFTRVLSVGQRPLWIYMASLTISP